MAMALNLVGRIHTLSQRRPLPATLFAALALLSGLLVGLLVVAGGNPLLAVAGFAGLAVGAIILVRPDAGIVLLAFITYIRLFDVLIRYYGAPSVIKLYVPLLFAFAVARWFLFEDRLGRWFVAVILLGAYWLVNFASMLYAPRPDLVLEGVVQLAQDMLLTLTIVLLLIRGRTWRQAIWALLAGGIFLGTLTTIQYLTGTFASNYGGFAHADVRHIVGETNEYRIAGPLSSNYYALVLVVLVPLALDRVWHEKRLLLRALAVWALLVTTLSIVFTFSRGGFIALTVVLFLMFVRIRPRPRVILVTLLLGLLLLPFIPERYGERLVTLTAFLPLVGNGEQIQEGAIRGRLSEITVAWLVFSDNPIWGIGYENFETQYLAYSPQLGLDSRREDRGAHSLYLEVAAETGVVGALLFGTFLTALLVTLVSGYRAFLRLGEDELAHLSVALAIGLVGFFTASLFLHSSYPLYFWLFAGIVLAVPGVVRTEQAAHAATVTRNHHQGA